MTNAVYLKTELRRSLRNRKFLLFSLGFPLLLFFMIAGPTGLPTWTGWPFRSTT